MNENAMNSRTLWWKIPAITLIYFVAVMVAGGIITATGMPWPELPGEATEGENLLLSLAGAAMMAICMAMLAMGLHGRSVTRWIILAAFCYVAFCLNNQIEAAIFTTFGGTTTMLVLFLLPCLAGAAAAGFLLSPDGPETERATVFHRGGISSWWWRVVAAWLAFPVIYIFFGMLVAPVVVPVYQAQDFGLTLPGMGTIIPVVLVRSALYLAVTVPIVMMWSRSRRSLVLTLGFAFFAMMGLIGLVTTTFFPPVLRIAHSIEILFDAAVYAWVIVALFVPKAKEMAVGPVAAATD